MNEGQDALNNLRDIHEPAQVAWWPPAAGWWLIVVLLVLTALALGWYSRRRHPRQRREALVQLRRLRDDFGRDNNITMLVSGLSMLVRRVTLAAFERPRVASLAGEPWLQFLDETGETSAFTRGAGRVLITAPYKPKETVDAEELIRLVETWIKKVT